MNLFRGDRLMPFLVVVTLPKGKLKLGLFGTVLPLLHLGPKRG